MLEIIQSTSKNKKSQLLEVSINRAITKRTNVNPVINKLESFEARTQTKKDPKIIVNILNKALR